MSHAAKAYGPRNGGTYVARAETSWGTLPDKIRVLAIACDMAGSLGEVAKQLGYSTSAVSAVLSNTYKGRLDRFEAKIDGVLMSAEVFCPAVGMSLARNACADNQKRKPSTASPMSMKFPAACKGCPNAFGGNNAS